MRCYTRLPLTAQPAGRPLRTFVGARASPPPRVNVALALLQVHRVVIGLDVVFGYAHQRKEEGWQGNLEQERWQTTQSKQAVASPGLQDEVLL